MSEDFNRPNEITARAPKARTLSRRAQFRAIMVRLGRKRAEAHPAAAEAPVALPTPPAAACAPTVADSRTPAEKAASALRKLEADLAIIVAEAAEGRRRSADLDRRKKPKPAPRKRDARPRVMMKPVFEDEDDYAPDPGKDLELRALREDRLRQCLAARSKGPEALAALLAEDRVARSLANDAPGDPATLFLTQGELSALARALDKAQETHRAEAAKTRIGEADLIARYPWLTPADVRGLRIDGHLTVASWRPVGTKAGFKEEHLYEADSVGHLTREWVEAWRSRQRRPGMARGK